MKHYVIRYIDKWSNGKVKETEYVGNWGIRKLIEFFGLNEPDVTWWEIKEKQ